MADNLTLQGRIYMFGFFREKQKPHTDDLSQKRQKIIEYFEATIKDLHKADPSIQKAVGTSINMANTAFINEYGSRENFLSAPNANRAQYIMKLNDFEKLVMERDPYLFIGFSLFKIWLVFYSDKEFEIANKYSDSLNYFSKKADFG